MGPEEVCQGDFWGRSDLSLKTEEYILVVFKK